MTLKSDRLFYGLHKDIRDSIRPAYQNSKIPFTDLLRAAREIEEELGIPSQTDTDSTTKQSKGKAKVASAVTPGLESTANLQKLAAAAQKCHEEQMKAQETLKDSQKLMNDMIATLAAFKSPTFHFNPGQGQGRRVEGDTIEVEVMAQVVVMVEAEVKIKIKMSMITSPILLLMAMVKMIKPKLLVVFPEDSLSVSIVNSKGLKGVIIGPIGVNF